MVDLARWLGAQLDTDERIARAATPGPWRYDPDKHWRRPGTSWFEEGVFAGPPGKEAICVAGTGETDDPPSMADAEHIAAHDPARVLREIDGRRRTLIRCEEEMLSGIPRLVHFAKQTLREMALPYEHRPGYAEAVASVE